MDTQCDIICLSLSRWDSPISSPALSLAKEFARKNRVFYIDHPFSWKDYWNGRSTPAIQSRKAALLNGKQVFSNPEILPANITIVTTRLTLPINFLPPGALYNKLAASNDGLLAETIRQTIRHFQLRDFIYINFFDPFFLQQLPCDIKPVRTVYQSMDDISGVPYSRRHGVRLEEKIIRNFDYTLCTSTELTRQKQAFSHNVYLHPNAVDISIFSKAVTELLPRPAELANISNKIIGFTGSIEYRSDFELLKKIAMHHHDKMLVFVGPIDTTEHIEVGLDKMPNVIFTGPKHITQLPNYLQYFDCVLIPYRKTPLTNCIYPLKINEYLAAGKPVVATHFSPDIKSFDKVAYVEDSHEAFVAAIDQAINSDSAEKKKARLEVASQNTWTRRVERFWEIISPEPR